MEISQSEIEHVAHLARLEIAEGEKEVFSEQLSHILTFMDQISKVDTEGVAQTSTVLDQSNVYRNDSPLPSLSVEQATANAPDADDGFFLVPKILGNR